jgi:hypothetical protein
MMRRERKALSYHHQRCCDDATIFEIPISHIHQAILIRRPMTTLWWTSHSNILGLFDDCDGQIDLDAAKKNLILISKN